MDRTATHLCDGIYFGEGPRWKDGRIWFSDFYAKAVKSASPKGDVQVEVEIDDLPSGIGWTPDGSLLIVSMVKRQVLRRTPDGRISVHADLSKIAAFHCNDMIVDSRGGAYVGNFGFDLHEDLNKRGDAAVIADHPTAKLVRISPSGTVSIAADGMHFPNGCVITADGRTLIVAETLAGCLTAFAIDPDGSLSGRRVFAETWPRVPDGIALDASGAVWMASALTPECVRIGEGGAVLDTVATSQNCFACMLGGEDGRTLFMMTAPTSLPSEAAAAPKGRVEVATVESPHAGLH
jgi:sugar lactone lactonase YvrE